MLTTVVVQHRGRMPPNPLLSPEPSAVVLAGDWDANTGRACEVLQLASSRGIRVVLQLGDFGFAAENGWGEAFLDAVSRRCVQADVDVFFVDGNHEDFPELLRLPIDRETGLRQVARRVYHLPRTLRWVWHGATWMALGGAHSIDRRDRREGVSWWPDEHLTDADVARAVGAGPVDAIIAHDAPDGVDIPGLWPADSVPASEAAAAQRHRQQVGHVVEQTQPAVLFHGHYHVRYTAVRGHTKVVGLADDSAPLRDHCSILDLTR